jgi:hypothetical protein
MPHSHKAWAVAYKQQPFLNSIRSKKRDAITAACEHWGSGWHELRKQGFKALKITITTEKR